jgi:two-component system NtrC family sensor kinase
LIFNEVERRQLAEAALRSITLSTSRTRGDEFFRVLVKDLASALDIHYVIAGEIVQVKEESANKTLAIWAGDTYLENITYSLKNTPCSEVQSQDMCFHSSNIQQAYPLDTLLVDMQAESYVGTPMIGTDGTTLGILVCLDTKPIDDNKRLLALTLLSIFSARCAAELQHRQRELELEFLVERRTKALESARDLLLQKEKLYALGSLVAGVAHAINTPLGNAMMAASSISDYSQNLHDIVNNPNVSRRAVIASSENLSNGTQLITHNLHRVSEIIDNFRLLAFSIDDEVASIINLHDFMNGVCITHQLESKNRHVQLTTSIPVNLSAKLPAAIFSKILSHLLMNALLHGFINKEHGTIHINAHAQGVDNKDLIIVVSDDGDGVSQETLPRLFEPFFTTCFGQGGSGLGLHVVYTLMQHLGGSIKISSQLGEGLQAELLIPACLS